MARRKYLRGFALALTLMASSAVAEQQTPGWYEIGENDEVKVWRMDVPGQAMPGFRGETLIQGPAEAVLTQVVDIDSHTEWMYRCAEARSVKVIDEHSTIAYNRTDSPWPAADRDVIVQTTVTRDEDGRVLRMSFRNVSSDAVPLQEGVVRMPRLKGAYTMTEISPNQTRVSYQVEADVGGRIPDWLATLIARDLPVKTLSSLRERVENSSVVAGNL
ncbi:START domain-containing protein [Marinobacter sp.]|uniref:START domain-containing protein n=1 Tax=Marinobacter sp. TaxID=50741 RepID=UPI0038509BB3